MPVAEDVPGQADSRAEQPFGVVARENSIAEQRGSDQNSVRIGKVIGGPSVGFRPARSELMADSSLQSKIVPHPDGIFDEPRAE